MNTLLNEMERTAERLRRLELRAHTRPMPEDRRQVLLAGLCDIREKLTKLAQQSGAIIGRRRHGKA